MKTKQVSIEISGDRLYEAARPIVAAMNKAQAQGFTLDEVLAATMYMVGAGIKQRGALLLVDAPLKVALPPLVQGYEAANSPVKADNE